MTLLGPGFPLARYEGNYTAILQTHTISLQAQVSLFQTGLVPSDARSLRFLGTTPAGLFQGTLSVSLGGVPLSLIVLQDFVTNALYAVDITSFAAQNAELRFTDTVGPGGSSDFFLDAITFSPIAVPEPGTWALLGLGSTFFWCAARRRK